MVAFPNKNFCEQNIKKKRQQNEGFELFVLICAFRVIRKFEITSKKIPTISFYLIVANAKQTQDCCIVVCYTELIDICDSEGKKFIKTKLNER